MHGSLRAIERENFKNSIIHRLDPRIKLIIVLLLIITATTLKNIYFLIILEFYMILLIILSKISLKNTLKRIIPILPFGLFIVLFQPFIRGNTIIFQIFGIPIYQEGLNFGILLFLKFLVSITSIVFLSSTTPIYKVILAGRKLGLPNIMSILLGLMIRYLFIMYDILQSTIRAQKSRALNRKNLSYKQILNIFGYTVGSIFIRAYEQGERTYLAMVSRGYSENSDIHFNIGNISTNDVILLTVTIILIIFLLVSQ
ncbi:cobalt ECF transporter T component CbiQ [Methanofervidicoccus abyssi]|uniref:Cobalt/nickel transport system permease protein n=1 Tax=Methanofervidicoccus abyssi TaxID=2082189 RepID=A0A401HNF4_9EURY|nr:cobalt ECF transporter T component CbiQ [Methanofervidicoccus abyssi]GBF35786.1 cobalt/nickel transport system permease protein [Methanofervidicoccus abyssi]